MFPLFFRYRLDALILYAAYMVWLLPEIFRSFLRRAGAAARVNNRYSGLVLGVSIWAGVALGYIASYRAPQLAIPWHRMLLFGIGIFLMLLGVVFRWYSILVLGRYFSVVIAIQPGQTVVEQGPYRYVRHPSYSGALLTILGLGLVFGNWLSLLVLLSFASLGYGYRIFVEERILVQSLGNAYRQYMKRTKRIIPFVI